MTITALLIITIACISLLFVMKMLGKTNRLNARKDSLRWVFVVFFALLGILSMYTVKRYMYPSEEIFSNSDYHILEHRGFKVKSPFSIVNGNAMEKALWDTKSGNVVVTHDTITISNYNEPFYISREVKKKQYYALANRTFDFDASKGFTVEDKGKVLLKLSVEPYGNGKDSCRYVINDTLESNFKKVIRQGYPLCDILAAAPGYVLTEEMYQLLQGSLLVREKIDIENYRYGTEKRSFELKGIDLVLMPGYTWFYENTHITANGQKIDPIRNFKSPSGKFFFSGIGRSKTDVFLLKGSGEDIELRYSLAKMHPFAKDRENVFLTSSVASIIDDPGDGGYYYNIFDLDQNRYHINANMKYKSGSSTESFAVEIMDMYSKDPSEKKGKEIEVNTADRKEFELSTLSDKLTWIFAVRNLRESNSVNWSYIFGILFIFIILVFVRIGLDYYLQTRSLSYIELSIYFLLLCLATIRLILSWRVSTFVPIEDVTGPVFAKMRSGRDGWTWFIWLYPIALILWSYVKNSVVAENKIRRIGDYLKEKDAILTRYSSQNKFFDFCLGQNARVVTFFLISLALCFISGHVLSRLERFMNIPIPLILYTLFDLWAVYRTGSNQKNQTKLRLLLGVILSGYLFQADAGFIAVFAVYLILLHGIIYPLTNGIAFLSRFGKRVALSFLSVGLIYLLLKFEGAIMIALFDSIKWLSCLIWVAIVAAASMFIWYIFADRIRNCNRKRRVHIYSIGVVAIIICLCLTGKFGSFISETVNGKAHMKWRAEVQKLDTNQTIDGLMLKSDFNSSDITYIMRSAHNQWFINQYLKDGSNLEHYFQLQPHSNQGSPYPTQTTDLAVTRYVIAEHGHLPAFLILSLFLLLIAIYCFEIRFSDEDGNQDRVLVGPLVLLFTVALLVYLSATNRIVFIGQDFPFVSIQSKVAVVFPVLLMLLSTFPIINDRMNGEMGSDSNRIVRQKRFIPVLLLVLYILVRLISPLGSHQSDKQFDVSTIISDISAKVDVLDDDFERYQRLNHLSGKSMNTVWESFKQHQDYSENYNSMLQADTGSTKFFASLLKYFDTQQKDKDNPEALLHMRKRGGYWHLTVNKRHYFVPSKKVDTDSWKGNVYAAESNRDFLFTNVKNGADNLIDSDASYVANLIPAKYRDKVANVRLVKFDESWIPEKEPLILVTSRQAQGSHQFYHIESSAGSIKGSPSYNQVATRILRGDALVLNVLDDNREVDEVVTWKYRMENDNYLAKNIWLNGKNRLFYPLGKEFIWSYQFANMVSSVYGNDEQYRDSSIRLSLDYELYQKFSDKVSSSNKRQNRYLTQEQIRDLERLAEEPFAVNSGSTFKYDMASRKVKYSKHSSDKIQNLLNQINKDIRQLCSEEAVNAPTEKIVADAVYKAIGRQYEFTAVVIDGDGKIRLMFDHGKTRVLDPNNVSHFNKYLSELYKTGDNASERDVFGNKALQIIPSGPGSSFKPILYTAVTSQQKLAWETIDVKSDYSSDTSASTENASGNDMYDYYGGVSVRSVGEGPLSIDSSLGAGLSHDNYLVKSDNLYHSVVTLLGMQRKGEQLNIMKPAGTGKSAFPVFMYRNRRMSFDPQKWFYNGNFDVNKGILNVGLARNFHLMELLASHDKKYTNYFGDGQMDSLFCKSGNYKGWVFAETGSLNVPDRALEPHLRNGFNQMFLGAYPLQVSPLQMCTMAMRLATLNAAPSITTLMDAPFEQPYEFFTHYDWNSDQEYFNFYKRQVLSQLRRVPKTGTASGMKDAVGKWESAGYYVYAKTGTLNDGREGYSKNSRMKHIMVIISNTQLETVSTPQQLKKVKYYAMYMSCLGIDKSSFSTSIYEPMIDAVIKSELFKKYMEE